MHSNVFLRHASQFFTIYVKDYADAKIGCVSVACHILSPPDFSENNRNLEECMVASFGFRNRDTQDFSICVIADTAIFTVLLRNQGVVNYTHLYIMQINK